MYFTSSADRAINDIAATIKEVCLLWQRHDNGGGKMNWHMTRLGIITEGKEGNLLLGSSVVDVKSKIVVEVRMYSSMKKKAWELQSTYKCLQVPVNGRVKGLVNNIHYTIEKAAFWV